MLAKGSWKWIAVFSVATNLLMIVPPLHMLQVYDRVLSSNSLQTLIYISLIAIFAMVLFGVAEAVRGKLGQRASARYTVDVSDPLFSRLSHNNEGARESAQILRDFNTVRGFLGSRTLLGLFDLPFAPFFLLLMFLLHWSLGLLTLIGLVALAAIAVLNKTVTSKQAKEAKQADMQALSFAQAVFMRAEDIRAMGLLPAVMERWGNKMAVALNSGDESAGQAAGFYGLSKSVRKILQICIMAWGAYLVILGEISGGVIFAASMISGRALAPIEQIIGGWDRIAGARAADANIKAFLAEDGLHETTIKLPEPKGHVSVSGLTYSPSKLANAKPVLDDVSFELEAGKILAIIGPSGAGKSTIARALVGAIAPDSGQIRLDGAERSQWPEQQWGEAVGYVSQEIALFPGTLAENVARLEVSPNEQRVVAAAQAAGIHDMITQLPDGYNTEIGPGKIMLSGGQKQRVALARAMYSDPRVLVLDEPNAHLDKQGEESLMAAILRARKTGRTIILVTQRRSVLRVADYVMTIRDGKVDSFVVPEVDRKQSKPSRSSKRASVTPPPLEPSMQSVTTGEAV